MVRKIQSPEPGALMRFQVQSSAVFATLLLVLATVVYVLSTPVKAQENQDALTPMTIEQMNDLVLAIDTEAQSPRPNHWVFTVAGLPLRVIADPANDRMRIMAPVVRVDSVPAEVIVRAMQANFDTALDARYAISSGVIWATYIHPFRPLQKDQFLSGIGQTANLVRTFGATYYSGALIFGGGDSQGLIERELLEELFRKGDAI